MIFIGHCCSCMHCCTAAFLRDRSRSMALTRPNNKPLVCSHLHCTGPELGGPKTARQREPGRESQDRTADAVMSVDRDVQMTPTHFAKLTPTCEHCITEMHPWPLVSSSSKQVVISMISVSGSTVGATSRINAKSSWWFFFFFSVQDCSRLQLTRSIF